MDGQQWIEAEALNMAAKFGVPPPPWIKRFPKSRVSARRLRVIGNEAFKVGDCESALASYNASLCYAPPGSKGIALVYGNKSAVYSFMGKFALALGNIELARKHGYPAEKMSLLDDREKTCMRMIEEFGPDQNFNVVSVFFELSHPPNEKIPFIANCLELRKDEKYGRGIITNTDLKTGDIIAIEKPAIAWINTEMYNRACSFCTKFSVTLIPCSHCTTVMFCSEVCQEKAAPIHFNDELATVYKGGFEKCLKMQLEAYRIAGGVDEALELLKDADGKTIFDFDFSDPDDPDYEKKMLIALNGLWRNTDMDREIIKLKLNQLLDIPLINEKPRSAEESEKLLKFIAAQASICGANMTRSLVGHDGIFLFKSLLNHSCIPNIHFSNIDDELILFACKPIKAGEQLFVSYCMNAAYLPKQERSKNLEIFRFTCDCSACVNDWPLEFPRKDGSFVEPINLKLLPEEAMEQFENNCKYIDENAQKMPCYEVPRTMAHSMFLIMSIAGTDFSELELLAKKSHG